MAARMLFGRTISMSRGGMPLIAAGLLLAAAMTRAAGGSALLTIARVWGDPRYLAHSVRELATFPVTIFPPAMFLLLRSEPEPADAPKIDPRTWRWLAAGSAVFGVLLAYQVMVPLNAGLGGLSQKPAFAHGGHLSVAYLLSFHYFEHFIDIFFFAGLALFLATL